MGLSMPITSEALSSTKRVYVVTVTYGHRIQYLREVINAAFASGAFKIIVVDNGSSQESRRAFKDIINESNGMVRFIQFPVNKGSAVGFSKGIKIATNQSDCDFVWLLDDDNTPDSNALAALIQSYDDIKIRYNHSFLCLISLRSHRAYLHYECNGLGVKPAYPRKSAFLRFHIYDFFTKVFQFFLGSTLLQGNKYKFITSPIEVPYCSYGGFFFHKSVISKIGYPDEHFFLYGDDTEYTSRISRLGGKLFLVPHSIIKDIDKCWRLKTKGASQFSILLQAESDFRIYYAVRNQVYFETRFWKGNEVIYKMNKFIFMTVLRFFTYNQGNIKRFKLIERAITHAEQGLLGQRNSLYL